MVTYSFRAGFDGTLVCYKSDNGLIKFTGKKAQDLLDYIKNFSFYNFRAETRKVNNTRFIYNMQFISNHHIVTYENIHYLKNKNIMDIEGEIEKLINIIRDNNANTLINSRNNLNSIIKKTNMVICSATLAAILMTSFNIKDNFNRLNNYQVEEIIDSTMINNASKSNIEVKNNIRGTKFTKGKIRSINYVNYKKLNEKIKNEENLNESKEIEQENNYDGPILTAKLGTIDGPNGKETFYDLNMKKVIQIMRDEGFSEEEYPFHIREDGAKMLGDYIMVAANLDIYPRGTIVETSLGKGIVCDTGDFAKTNKKQLDIATNWTRHKQN